MTCKNVGFRNYFTFSVNLREEQTGYYNKHPGVILYSQYLVQEDEGKNCCKNGYTI